VAAVAIERFREQHCRAEEKGKDGERTDQTNRRAAMDAGFMHGGMAPSAGDQPAVEREGRQPGDRECE
jgi:hypothetical protein